MHLLFGMWNNRKEKSIRKHSSRGKDSTSTLETGVPPHAYKRNDNEQDQSTGARRWSLHLHCSLGLAMHRQSVLPVSGQGGGWELGAEGHNLCLAMHTAEDL